MCRWMIARSIISLVSDHDLRPQPHTRPHVRISTALAQSPQNLPLFLRSHTPVHNSCDPFVGLIAACVRGKPTHPSPPQPPTHPPHQPTDPHTTHAHRSLSCRTTSSSVFLPLPPKRPAPNMLRPARYGHDKGPSPTPCPDLNPNSNSWPKH